MSDLFGETTPGYGLKIEPDGDMVEISIRKGHGCTRISIAPKEARKLARAIYDTVKEVER